jgi:hypothetical protein
MPQPLKGLDRKDIKIDTRGFFSAASDEPSIDEWWYYYFMDGGITLKYWDTSDWHNKVLIHTIKFVKKPALWESPNLNGNGDEIERLDAKGRIWTIRKLEQELSVNTREGNPLVNVREFPGITERVLFRLDNGAAVETLAITKESETIGGFDSEWVKVRASEGQTGWMFGAYTEAKDREGPKFLTPENIDNWQKEHGIRPFSGVE